VAPETDRRHRFLMTVVSSGVSLLFHLLVLLVLLRTVVWVVERQAPEQQVVVHFREPPVRSLLPEKPGPPAPQPAPEAGVRAVPQAEPPPPPPQPTLGVGELSRLYSLRQGRGRQVGLREGGGSAGSENAVQAGLRWLAAHQDADGHWDAQGFTKHCPPEDTCGGRALGRVFEWPFDLGVTGLSLLAFLGAGNTPGEGEYKETAARAVNFILRSQLPNGGFSEEPERLIRFPDGKVIRARRISIYSQAICALALAEGLAMTEDESLRGPVERAVNFLLRCQQEHGGWDYFQFRTGRSDSSVTGWVVMALKSASAAGVHVPPETWYRTFGFIESMSTSEGYLRYTNLQSRYGIALAAVGLLCRQYLGWPRDSEEINLVAELLLSHPPEWEKLAKWSEDLHSMYYWYYGTLALHHLGGSYWERWNTRFRDMLISHQETRGHRSGSWEPAGLWAGRHAGRVYSTALSVLDLEIYYRYLPLYQLRPDPALLEALLYGFEREPDPGRRHQLLENLGQFVTEPVTKVLRGALEDADEAVRFEAARQLVAREDDAGVGVLREALEGPDSFRRARAVELLGRLRSPKALGGLIDAVGDDQPFVAELAAGAIRALTGHVLPGLASTAQGRRRQADELRRLWEAGELRIPRPLLQPVAEIVAVRATTVAGEEEVVARLLPEWRSKAEQVLISGGEFPILRGGLEVGRLRVERTFADGAACTGRVSGERQGGVRQGDLVFAPRAARGEARAPAAGEVRSADDQ